MELLYVDSSEKHFGMSWAFIYFSSETTRFQWLVLFIRLRPCVISITGDLAEEIEKGRIDAKRE